jgi:hypothetical protein
MGEVHTGAGSAVRVQHQYGRVWAVAPLDARIKLEPHHLQLGNKPFQVTDLLVLRVYMQFQHVAD